MKRNGMFCWGGNPCKRKKW